MAYLYLALTCTLFSVQFVFTKNFSKRAAAVPHAGIWNGAVIAFLMLCYMLPLNGFRFEFSWTAAGLAFCLAATAITMSLGNIPAMRLGNLSMVTTYMLIGGMVLPFVYGVLALEEDCSPLKLFAVSVLIIAILPNLVKKRTKAQEGATSVGKRVLFHLLCLLLFTLNGVTSILTTVHSLHPDRIESGRFTMLYALFQLVLSVLILLGYAVIRRVRGERGAMRAVFFDMTAQKPATARAVVTLMGFGFGYALCNGVANIFSQESLAAGMPSSVQFPVISGAVIVLTALFGHIWFGERIDRQSALSLLLSVAGAVLFMFA